MNKDYWYPWKPNKFKGDTMHLTALQDGIYRRLIDHYMETKEPLPDSDIALARVAGVTVDEFVDNSKIIRAFFIADDKGRLKNKECDKNLKKEKQMSKSYAERGKKGGKAKALKDKETQGLEHESRSNSQAIAKQPSCLNVPQDKTGQDRTIDNKPKVDSDSQFKKKTQEEKKINTRSPRPPGWGGNKPFKIEPMLLGDDILRARQGAPGWDIYFLMREFDSRVNSGTFNRPEKAGKAFVGWCKSFTKGKPPK